MTDEEIKMVLWEMVNSGELRCDCDECDCQLVVETEF